MDLPLDTFDLTPDVVRERFNWAIRRGQPAWLWPDLPVERWQEALVSIEAAVRGVLTGGSAMQLDGDPDALGVASYTSGVGPLLGYWLERGVLSASEPVAAMLKLHLQHNRLRMERMTRRTIALVEALTARGVGVTLLKGMHTAHCYFPEPGTRPASDIDILIAASDEKAANETLRNLRFEPGAISSWPPERNWRLPEVPVQPRSLCFAHADDPWSVDLQRSLNRRYSAGAAVIRLDDVAARMEPWPVAHDAQVLGQPVLLLQLAVHASCGLTSLTLLRMVELIFVIRRDTQEGLLRWDEFMAAAERADALGMIYPALRLCEQLAPGTIPDDVYAACVRQTPVAVQRIVDRLTPANAQRVVRCSLAERFMWTPSPTNVVRQILLELIPPGANSFSRLLKIYQLRAWRLARRTLTQ